MTKIEIINAALGVSWRMWHTTLDAKIDKLMLSRISNPHSVAR